MTYKYQVCIGKRFVSGLLSGTYHNDKVRFATWKAADDYRLWAESHKTIPAKPCAGVSEFIIDYAFVEAIAPKWREVCEA